MKKLKKETFKGLRDAFRVMSVEELMETLGGNDCWWRCLAYAASDGQDSRGDNAYSIASVYYSYSDRSYDEASYGGFSGNYYDRQNCINDLSHLFSSSYQILTFKPDDIPRLNISSNDLNHSVILTHVTWDSIKCDSIYHVWDPQMGIGYEIYQSELQSNGNSGLKTNKTK